MKILYVDDEKDLLELASTFFADENLPIDTASDVAEAMGLIRRNNYDIIIADVRMPSGSGVELIRKAREEKIFSGKCILASGDVKSHEAKAAECELVINKPVDFFALIDSVKELLQNK